MDAIEKIILIEDIVRKHSKATCKCFSTEEIKTLTTTMIIAKLKTSLNANKFTNSVEIETIINELEIELNTRQIPRVFFCDLLDDPYSLMRFNTDRIYRCEEKFESDKFIFFKNEVVEIVKCINSPNYFALPHFAEIKAKDFDEKLAKIEISCLTKKSF